MRIEIITVGDELLMGQIVDINSAFIASKLLEHSFRVRQTTCVSDHKEAMIAQIHRAFEASDVVIMTGGLGPTKDDLTKAVLAEYFNSGWRWDQEALKTIASFFSERNRILKEINKKQAYLPDNCETIPNHWGTAPGMLFKKEGKLLASLPGVPSEMQNMFTTYVLPQIQQHFKTKPLWVQHFLTVSIPESLLSEKLAFVEDVLPDNMSLAYLPNLNQVRLRLTCEAEHEEKDRKLFLRFVDQIKQELANNLVTDSSLSLQEYVIALLKEQNKSLALAESCTGGMIAQSLVAVSGASSVFKGGVVSYSNESKMDILNVEESDLKLQGAVSAPVVEQMARNAQKAFNADYALSVSGIAGPEGGSELKPVGTVYIGLATPTMVTSFKVFHPGERLKVMQRTMVSALNFLRLELVKGSK